MLSVLSLVELPQPLQLALIAAVLYGVRLALGKYLPEDKVSEIAAAVSAAVLTAVGAFLGLIPAEFEAVANAVLQLLAVALGMVFVARLYVGEHKRAMLKG